MISQISTPSHWEWKAFWVIVLGIIVISGLIWYSYRLTNRGAKTEGFKTYSELANELNENRTDLLNISKNQNQIILDVDPDVTKYISADSIFPEELKQRLNTNFDIRFSQKLQDTEIQDLQGQLDALKLKMSKLPPSPTKYILKNLGGSAFDMLGTPNDFSLRMDPNAARCLGFSLSGIRELGENNKDGVYKSSLDVQCDAGGLDKTQRFKLTEITDNLQFNKLVGDAYSVPEYYTLNTYPFMVAQPVNGTLRPDGMINECITFDNSGLSVEPCTGNDTQKWHTYSVNN